MNTIPEYICECDVGYSLDSDNRSCVANADCSEGVCYCLDGFTDVNDSQNGTLASLNCVGMLISHCIAFIVFANVFSLRGFGKYNMLISFHR